jgi:uncharacterized protein
MNRKMMIVAAGVIAAVMMTAGCSMAGPSQASAANQAGAGGPAQATGPVSQTVTLTGRGITVVGVGKASGAPDVANVNVGVETQAANVQQAVADNRAQMTKLLEALKALGIADKDISTSNYSVYTERQPVAAPVERGSAEGALTYRVSNQVQVVVRDVAKLGEVLDKVVEAGANNIYGVSFSVAETSKLENDARAQAMTDARARAESLAKLAGVSLGEVVSVSEVIGGGPLPYAKSAAEGLGGGSTPIQPGSLDVNMSVQVTFAIK